MSKSTNFTSYSSPTNLQCNSCEYSASTGYLLATFASLLFGTTCWFSWQIIAPSDAHLRWLKPALKRQKYRPRMRTRIDRTWRTSHHFCTYWKQFRGCEMCKNVFEILMNSLPSSESTCQSIHSHCDAHKSRVSFRFKYKYVALTHTYAYLI